MILTCEISPSGFGLIISLTELKKIQNIQYDFKATNVIYFYNNLLNFFGLLNSFFER